MARRELFLVAGTCLFGLLLVGALEQVTRQEFEALIKRVEVLENRLILLELRTGGAKVEGTPRAIPKAYAGRREGHWITKNTAAGRIIVLDDKSQWEIRPLDNEATAQWQVGDNISILDSSEVRFPFILSNTKKQTVAGARFIGEEP